MGIHNVRQPFSNYAINPTPELYLRSNRALLPARVIAALGRMSYFVVMCGPNSASVEVAVGCLVPFAQAQSYLKQLESDLAKVDVGPSFFWDDGATGTSDDIVCAAEEAVCNGEPIEQTPFGRAIVNCEALGVSLRVWWANNSPDAYRRIPAVGSSTEAFAIMREKSGNGAAIGFAMRAYRAAT